MEYKFDRYDHMERLDIVKEYNRLVILVVKEKTVPYAIFGLNGLNRSEYEVLCIAETEDELYWKLIAVHQKLEEMGIKYEIEKRME